MADFIIDGCDTEKSCQSNAIYRSQTRFASNRFSFHYGSEFKGLIGYLARAGRLTLIIKLSIDLQLINACHECRGTLFLSMENQVLTSSLITTCRL